jgi:16S rRNA (guanine527-N7)-methyltransferase
MQLQQILTYLDLLLRWNARVNLTAVREPEEIVTRHFGESLFAASQLFPAHVAEKDKSGKPRLIDVGSGAGFPGLPIKIWNPAIQLTLIEANHKKATFLREVARALALRDVDVYAGRAEEYAGRSGDLVTLRAVERFHEALPLAARLVSRGGRLALLIGEGQLDRSRQLTPEFVWSPPIAIPLSERRVLAVGTRRAAAENHPS